ncbi:hypothetical protein ANCCEY_13375 [Ancylostoma ceylanicum]|uniref:Glutaminase EF-hand domain-containing protein n=1 Tax=Ancylostoma ceylanicum TaxID=53326 RepID=A0A0D6LIT2_9BILA|nr:hypothetical protein ANCCEY_13375 [Ancylostoma ceylanicum]
MLASQSLRQRTDHSEKTVETIGAILQQEDTSVKRKVSKTMEVLKSAHETFHPASPADLIFELFKVPNKEYASITKLLKVLKSFGLRERDPRLKEMMERIQQIEDLREDDNQGFHLRRHAFKEFCGVSGILH